jgi:hypothetical protein
MLTYADVILQAEEWVRQLTVNNERHLTQYSIIKGLERALSAMSERCERAERMLLLCQQDHNEETRQLLEDYRQRLAGI